MREAAYNVPVRSGPRTPAKRVATLEGLGALPEAPQLASQPPPLCRLEGGLLWMGRPEEEAPASGRRWRYRYSAVVQTISPGAGVVPGAKGSGWAGSPAALVGLSA